MKEVKSKFRKILSSSILIIVIVLHIVILIVVPYYKGTKQQREDNDIFKIVDVEEYVPPVVVEPEELLLDKEVIEIALQDKIVEDVIETEEKVVETASAPPLNTQNIIEYLLQHKISSAPELPGSEIKAKIEYPAMARRQGIEGVVYLLLYIDQFGKIRDIEVLQDPGYGFGDAAVSALADVECIPAEVNGTPVATMFRYPVRFSLN